MDKMIPSKQGHSDWIPPRPLPTQCPPYDGPRIYQPPSGPCKYPLPPSITLLPIYCEIPSGYLKPVFLVHWPSLLPGQQCMGNWEGHKNREKLKTCLKTKIKKFPPSSIQTIYHIIYIFADLCEINFLDSFSSVRLFMKNWMGSIQGFSTDQL